MSDKWCTDREYDDFKSFLVQEAGGKPVCYYDGKIIDLKLSRRSGQSFTIDHIKPRKIYPQLAKVKTNLVPAHKSCNSEKGTQTAEQALADKARKRRGTREEWNPIGGK